MKVVQADRGVMAPIYVHDSTKIGERMAKLTPETPIKILVDHNPHKAGSKDFSKFEKLKGHTTVGKALKAGLDTGYLVYGHKKKWFELGGVQIEASPSAKPKKNTEPTGVRKVWGSNKPQVMLYNDPEVIAELVVEGEEQSEVKFPNGNLRFIPNQYLTKLKEVSE